jgi:hypothetical protein
MPRTTPVRLFFYSWICFSLAINTVFQAYLTTFLIDPGFEKSITSLKQLISSGIKYGYMSSIFDPRFNDSTDQDSKQILENRVDCSNLNTCLTWTMKYRNFSTLSGNIITNNFYYTSQLSKEYGDYKSCLMKESAVLFVNIVMLLQKGSPLLDRVNDIITRVSEGGIFNHWMQSCAEMREVNKAEANTAKKLPYKFCDLNMTHMQSAFYILFFGQGLSMMCFLTEILYYKCFFRGRF